MAAGVKEYIRTYGTIHCSALDARGEISAGHDDLGLFFKMPGRVGTPPSSSGDLRGQRRRLLRRDGARRGGDPQRRIVLRRRGVRGALPEEAGFETLKASWSARRGSRGS